MSGERELISFDRRMDIIGGGTPGERASLIDRTIEQIDYISAAYAQGVTEGFYFELLARKRDELIVGTLIQFAVSGSVPNELGYDISIIKKSRRLRVGVRVPLEKPEESNFRGYNVDLDRKRGMLLTRILSEAISPRNDRSPNAPKLELSPALYHFSQSQTTG